MAQVNKLTGTIIDRLYNWDTAESLVGTLDTALFNVGVSVSMIRDMSLHGSPGASSTECIPEEVAALAEGLLAYLAQVGGLVDRLEARVIADDRARRS